MINVRRATIADAAVLPTVERSSGQVFLTIDALAWVASAEIMSATDHLPAIEAGTAWVAENAASPEPTPVGFVSAQRFKDVLHTWELAVCANYQRQGIGRRLMGAAAEWGRGKGLSRLELTTFLDVPWNRPYYEGLGFETIQTANLSARLKEILEREAAEGLPSDQRCAMFLAL